MKKCPCEECISFAICYQKEVITCRLLYTFMCTTKKSNDANHELEYCHYNKGTGRILHSLYNRYLARTYCGRYEITLSEKETERFGRYD